MGSTQGRPSMNSPPTGLQKLKMDNGYVKGGHAAARRSTGQRHYTIGARQFFRHESRHGGGSGETGSGSRGSHEKKPITREGVRVSYDGGSDEGGTYGRSGTTSSAGSRGSQEKKLINLEEQRDSSSANGGVGSATVRISSTKSDGDDGELVDVWPKWLTDNIPKDALAGLTPRSAETYDKIDKVGQGTYSNVYKARDKYTGKVFALKKVRFDTSEPESVKFMAREIRILRKLDHPNIVKLEGLATSRMHYSIYLVFDYMQCDLASIISRPDERLTEPQVKCYMHQLLSGLQHCHDKGILHRDIKGSNLLIDKKGMLKIADFGLANYYNPEKKRPLTSRVVTLWYRAPELLLGSTEYGVGIDLWSAGCLMAEMFTGRPIMPGRTEVEQVNKIFKLCGTPPDDFWKKVKLATKSRPPQTYKPRLREAFRNFHASSVGLLSTLLALDPASRGSAASALRDEFFHTSPLACDLSGLPVIHKVEDEAILTSERKKSFKMRHRSPSHREHRNKDIAAEKPEEDRGGSEEPVKSVVTITLIQGSGSSATSTSSSGKLTTITSFDATDIGNKDSIPPTLASPDMPNQQSSSKTEAHHRATKNIKNRPPLPDRRRSSRYNSNNNNNNENIFQFHEQVIKRSVSTREYRNLDRNKLLELHAVD